MIRDHIPIPRTVKKKKVNWGRMPHASKRRMKINKEYNEKARAFVNIHRWCEWSIREHTDDYEYAYRDLATYGGFWATGHVWYVPPPSEEVHHMAGRKGVNPKTGAKLLLDESLWMAVSRKAHTHIHRYPKVSEEKGYIVRLKYTNDGGPIQSNPET